MPDAGRRPGSVTARPSIRWTRSGHWRPERRSAPPFARSWRYGRRVASGCGTTCDAAPSAGVHCGSGPREALGGGAHGARGPSPSPKRRGAARDKVRRTAGITEGEWTSAAQHCVCREHDGPAVRLARGARRARPRASQGRRASRMEAPGGTRVPPSCRSVGGFCPPDPEHVAPSLRRAPGNRGTGGG